MHTLRITQKYTYNAYKKSERAHTYTNTYLYFLALPLSYQFISIRGSAVSLVVKPISSLPACV